MHEPRTDRLAARSIAAILLAFGLVAGTLAHAGPGAPDAAGPAARDSKLLRYPDVHGNTVAFVHGGDIWTVPASGGLARRITSHPGLELFPKFSPDGSRIAFTGQYEGDEQVYVIPATGGEPDRLTSYPAAGPLPARWGYDNQVIGWTQDGSAVLFRSHRDHFNIASSRLYTVALDGGLPEALPMAYAGAGALSPDGSSILYTPLSRDFRTWKRYAGGWAQDLWIYDFESGAARKVTDHVRSDRDPMWTDAGLFFVSDRDDYLNLYRLEPGTAAAAATARQLTTFRADVRWASADQSGNIVYELDGELQLYDSAQGASRRIPVVVPSDSVSARPRTLTVSADPEHFSVAANGRRVALVARGDVYSVPVEDGVVRNLTQTSTAHERLAAWAPDGETLAFVSDRSGEEEVWLADAGGQLPPRQLTSGNRMRFFSLRWAPDGERLAAGDMHGDLFVLRTDDGKLSKVGEMGAWYNQDFSWSADGRFLAWSALNDTFLREIRVWDAASGQDRAVTSRYFNSFAPAWHPAGQHLYYLSDRELSPQLGALEWNYVVDRQTQMYALALNGEAGNPFAPRNDEANAKPDESSADTGSDESVATRVEFAEIEQRVIRVPIEADNYVKLAVTDTRIVLLKSGPAYYGREVGADGGLVAFSIPERELTVLVAGSGERPSVSTFDISADGRFLVLKQGDELSRLDLSQPAPEPVPIAPAPLQAAVVPREEWATIFEESWRRFRDFFYVENMHGYDWDALGEKYRALLPHVSHRSDLNYLIGEMIAELNAGHAYVYGGDEGRPSRPAPGLLGASFEFDAPSGLYRIAGIMRGDNSEERYRSPLTEVGVDVDIGDYVLAINGRRPSRDLSPYAILRDAGHAAVELRVNDRPDDETASTQLVEPIASERNLHYLEWTRGNREYVRRVSDGRIGYLHLPNMGADGIREFIKWYYGQIRSDGLIVDVRGNGGGNVSQMILERLLRKHYSTGYVKGERHPRTYPWGVGGNRIFTGELAVIADETTLSDGDAFTWTFQQAKRGRTIGMRTWGGVIGIDDTGTVLDGGRMNVPQFAFADHAGRWVVEGEGVSPDIAIENDPSSLADGRDLQLERAVAELLAGLGERRPGRLPEPAPAPVKTPRAR